MNDAARSWPAVFPRFTPRLPWLTGDLQTVRNHFVQRPYDLSAWPAQRVEFDMRDGTGDRLLGDLHRPIGDAPKPLVVLLHGLTGCSESLYMQSTTRHLLGLGYSVLRLNLRGARPTRALCKQRYHAGRSADLAAVLSSLDAADRDRGVLAVGFSLGGNILIKYLAEQGEAGPVKAAATVSAPIDLAASCRRLMAWRNRLYHGWLLDRMRGEELAVANGLTASERAAVANARSIFELDDRFVAPRNGFSSAEDYYTRSAGVNHLPAVKVPTLMVHSLDDPWIPGDIYQAFGWRSCPTVIPLLSRAGGHVGFHGSDSPVPWHDRCVGMFFEVVAAES